MKLLVIGPQGSGKGTIATLLAKKLGVPSISTGQLIRDLPDSDSEAAKVKQLIAMGVFAPDDFMGKLITKRLEQADCANGYVVDGFPRSISQLNFADPDFDKVIVLNVSRETSIKRVTGRRLCESDGKTYNIYTLPPEELKNCKGNLIQRADDTPEALEIRLNLYAKNNPAILDHYKAKLIEVSAEPLPDQIASELFNQLGLQ